MNRSISIDYLQEIKAFHQMHIEPYKGKPLGCSFEEIEKLEREIGFPLPLAYMQYLLWMGKDYGGVFRGSEWFIKTVVLNPDYLSTYLKEGYNPDFQLSPNYLVFMRHGGYLYAWFDLPAQNDNPEVYFAYLKDEETIDIKRYPNFTDFLFKDMQANAFYLKKIYK